MPVERAFIKLGLKRMEIEEFLEKELGRAGYSGVTIRKIPTGTRVTLHVERPGMVIGRKGKSIKHLTDELSQRFGLENPQVEVLELPKPELSGQVMAKRIAFALERGVNPRRIGYSTLRRIMNAGAKGVEIVISGRIAGERSRSLRFYQGHLSKAGEPAEKIVSSGYAVAILKPGVAGVKVRIMPPDVPLPGDIRLKEGPSEAMPGEGKLEEVPREKSVTEEGGSDQVE